MFTQSHYVKVADVIRRARTSQQGEHVRVDPMVAMDHSAINVVVSQQRQIAINELTLKLCEMFKRDNPKFNDLIFIEACNGDLIG